jgi:hypothetical protein
MNELLAAQTHRVPFIDLSRSLTAHSLKGRTQLKIRPQEFTLRLEHFLQRIY